MCREVFLLWRRLDSGLRMTSGGRRFLGFWVAAVVLGGVLVAAVQPYLLSLLYGLVTRLVTSPSINTLNWAYPVVDYVVVVVSAVAIAGPPAFVLGRRLVGIEVPWIVASAVAALVAAAIPVGSWLADWTGHLIAAPAGPSLVVLPLIYGVVGGCVTGVAQAIVLKPYVRGVAWWIAATILARGTANVVDSLVSWQIAGGGTGTTALTDTYGEEVVGALVGWLILGIVTGLVLVRLLGERDLERPGDLAVQADLR
jgi:hypothetical protein